MNASADPPRPTTPPPPPPAPRPRSEYVPQGYPLWLAGRLVVGWQVGHDGWMPVTVLNAWERDAGPLATVDDRGEVEYVTELPDDV